MEKKEWLTSFTNNIDNYEQYKILNIDPKCYESFPCFHNTLILFNNQKHEVLISAIVIGRYQKYHKELSLHFIDYISTNKN